MSFFNEKKCEEKVDEFERLSKLVLWAVFIEDQCGYNQCKEIKDCKDTEE